MGEVGAGRHDARVSQSAASRHLFLSSFSVSQSIFLSLNVTGDERVGRVAMSMEGKGPGDGFVWEEEDVLSGCICWGEAAPLVEVSMLRSREGVNIGCDREVSN